MGRFFEKFLHGFGLGPLWSWLGERRKPYYLLHIEVQGMRANTYIEGSLGDFVAKHGKTGHRELVIFGEDNEESNGRRNACLPSVQE